MKSQTGVFKRQPAEIQDAAHVGFKIRNDLLVVHRKYKSRQHVVPVIHQVAVLNIVFAKLCQVVTEWLATREELLVRTETTVQRVASRVDYLRVWNRQTENPGKGKIVRIFVDEVWRITSEYFCPFQVVRANSGPFMQVQGRQLLRESLTTFSLAADPAYNARQVAEFMCAVNLAVTRQNLFDQGGAGSWQANNENWRDFGGCSTFVFRQKLLIE